jgi:hypothetical protein
MTFCLLKSLLGHCEQATLWEKTYQKHYILVNVLKFTKHLVNVHQFTKHLVNVHKFTKCLVNSYHQKDVKHYILTNWNQITPI